MKNSPQDEGTRPSERSRAKVLLMVVVGILVVLGLMLLIGSVVG